MRTSTRSTQGENRATGQTSLAESRSHAPRTTGAGIIAIPVVEAGSGWSGRGASLPAVRAIVGAPMAEAFGSIMVAGPTSWLNRAEVATGVGVAIATGIVVIATGIVAGVEMQTR
jgi:hypothetical protein